MTAVFVPHFMSSRTKWRIYVENWNILSLNNGFLLKTTKILRWIRFSQEL